MAIKLRHSTIYSMYFCTFTCYNWLHLIHLVEGYDLIYQWFNYLRTKNIGDIVAYVIMPNHVHCIMYFPTENFDLNKIIGNGKRFMAYDIIKRLKKDDHHNNLLERLQQSVSFKNSCKGQKHNVFEPSFDAKPIYSDRFFFQKLDYIHLNPVSKNWQLVDVFTDYEHSSASYYELNIVRHFEPLHYNDI
jgi:putative transposase